MQKDLKTTRVFFEPIESFSLEIKGLELLLKVSYRYHPIRVTKDYVFYLVIDYPSPVSRESRFEIRVLLHRPERKASAKVLNGW